MTFKSTKLKLLDDTIQGINAADGNAGTIEVIVLRCSNRQRSSGSYTLPQRRKSAGNKNKKENSTDAKAPAKSSNKTASKTPAKPSSDSSNGKIRVGGFFGLFDGPGDDWASPIKPGE